MDANHMENPQESFNLDQLAAEIEQAPETKKKPRKLGLIIAGMVGLIVLLGAAAFVAFRLLGKPADPQAVGGPGFQVVTKGDGGGVSRSFSMQVTPAPEVPTTAPELAGSYSRVDGNSLFVHQVAQGAVSPENANSGPEVEIVITADTLIYKDTTSLPDPSQASDNASVQETVQKVDHLEEMTDQTFFRVWGERRGDRVIAQVIVYTKPVIKIIQGP